MPRLRRAGLDYREWTTIREHASLDAFEEAHSPRRTFAFSTRGETRYCDVSFRGGRRIAVRPRDERTPRPGARAVSARVQAPNPDAAGQPQPEPVERGRRRLLRGVATAIVPGTASPGRVSIGTADGIRVVPARLRAGHHRSDWRRVIRHGATPDPVPCRVTPSADPTCATSSGFSSHERTPTTDAADGRHWAPPSGHPVSSATMPAVNLAIASFIVAASTAPYPTRR